MIAVAKPETVRIGSIQPSPENDEIYGAIDLKDNDLINLANDIAENGIREPIIVSFDDIIISGHRRYAAARLVKLKKVPIVRLDIAREDCSYLEWQQLLAKYNLQRVKPAAVRIKEAALAIDPDIAYQQLLEQREERDRDAPPRIKITGQKKRSSISDRKVEMLNAAISVIEGLALYWPITVRQIHYGLLNRRVLRNSSKGTQRSWYENNAECYKDLCDLLTRARLLGIVPWEAITDETRPVSGTRYMKDAATFFDLESYNFLRGYRRDLLQSQSDHVELIVEKLTVQGIIQPIANMLCVPLTVGRGYCSIDPRYEIVQRYLSSGKDRLRLLIASDFDPDGEEIAESFVRSIRDDFNIPGVSASKILLRQDQVQDWQLPHNGMEAKESSSKFKKFIERYGENFVFELEAVPPAQMQEVVQEAIESTIDLAAFNRELAQEKQDAAKLQGMKSQLAHSFPDMAGNGGER